MNPCSCKLVNHPADASDWPSKGRRILRRVAPVRSERKLNGEIEELNLKLAIAQEARRLESDRLKLAEVTLLESGQKFQRQMDEYKVILEGLQRQMEQTRKLQDLGTIVTPALAHDLKNLLAAISSLSQFCVERMNRTSPLGKQLRMIYENSQRANRLIANFLDFARSVKCDPLVARPIDLHDLMRRIWKIAESATVSRHVSWITRFDKRVPKIMGDPEKMERLFLNLFLNAIQAIRKKGRITTSTQFLESERAVEILISDTGTGIPKKYHKRILEPFFTTKRAGTGLGLSTCRAILLQFGGSIRFDSIPRRGTKVYIRFPVAISEPLDSPA